MSHQDAPDQWAKWWPRVVAIVGLGVFVYVALSQGSDRPYLLGSLLILITGAPIGLLLDAYLRRRNGGG